MRRCSAGASRRLRASTSAETTWSATLTASAILTDSRMPSSYAIRNSATAAMPIFLPGNGRAFSAGVTYRF